jgi:transcriptional regulator with GAF, ATPase, and Fis domain
MTAASDAECVWDEIGVGLGELDASLTIRRLNVAANRLLGGPSVIGRRLLDLLGARDRSALQGLAPAGPTSRITIRDAALPGTGLATVDLVLSPWPHGQSGAAFLLTVIDAGERAALSAELGRVREKLAESERARMRLSSIQAELVETGTGGPPVMVGSSPALQRVRSQIARVAPGDTTVLIQGETGTGKELVARLIHAESARAREAFVAVNCAALPESLIESELFGHERGAFTGADRRRLGKFELADGGTLFLDEIAELPLAAQAKLLRVLQGGSFERVGGTEPVKIDARVVAATHRDLARRVERGLFRDDLFYRLNVFRIDVPPLRDRPEDLRALVEHLHAETARRLARPILPVSERSMRRVMAYRWPGNIRELRNAVERATLLADGAELEIEMPESPVGVGGGGGAVGVGGADGRTGRIGQDHTRDVLLDLTLEQLERLQITHALETTDHRVFGPGGAAEKLDINPSTLLSRMDKLGIPRPRAARASRRTPAG